MTRGIRLLWLSPRIRDTHTYCQAFSRGAVTTCFYDLGLSRLGFEHPTFRLRGERSNPLPHRRGDSEYLHRNIKMGHRLKHDWLLYALYMYPIASLTSFKTLLHVYVMYELYP